MVKPEKELKLTNYNLTNHKINRKTEILREELDDETVLFNPKSRNTYVLNDMADVIWELCDGDHTPIQISEEIVSAMHVNSDIVLNDVLNVVQEFIHQNLVDVN